MAPAELYSLLRQLDDRVEVKPGPPRHGKGTGVLLDPPEAGPGLAALCLLAIAGATHDTTQYRVGWQASSGDC
jgi:hypothetical protein